MSDFVQPISGVRHVQVQWDDTIQDLALRELGDASQWVSIVELNQLRAPYFTGFSDRVGNGVVLYGSTILVPSNVVFASSSVDPDLVFERDVQLNKGKLTVVNGDFGLISGVPNLKQAIKIRLDTNTKELIFHPEYGCMVQKLIGTTSGPVTAQLAAAYVSAALMADDRIQSVKPVNTRVVGDSLSIDGMAVPVSGRPVPFEAVL